VSEIVPRAVQARTPARSHKALRRRPGAIDEEKQMIRILSQFALGLAAVALIAVAGCNRGDMPQPAPSGEQSGRGPSPADKTPAEHAHKPGGHGGLIFEIGRDSYHAEAVFEKNGVVRLYTLGKDEARVQEVEAQPLTAYVRPEGGTESTPTVFAPEPAPEDGAGKTSRFLARLPRELWDRPVEITVPNITIGGERFRLGFRNAPAHTEDPMPAQLEDSAAAELYLKPGGKYTAEDVRANGGMTAAQKFKGMQASHDLKPRPGDKVCPVTLTKANPKFTWIVGGKAYEFCCPPCVDEFVQAAKEHPDDVKDPREYIKK
jgi:hypothetical protein